MVRAACAGETAHPTMAHRQFAMLVGQAFGLPGFLPRPVSQEKGEGMSRIAGSSFSEVHLGEQDEADPVELDPERPFRILLAGDFSGREERGEKQER